MRTWCTAGHRAMRLHRPWLEHVYAPVRLPYAPQRRAIPRSNANAKRAGRSARHTLAIASKMHAIAAQAYRTNHYLNERTFGRYHMKHKRSLMAQVPWALVPAQVAAAV